MDPVTMLSTALSTANGIAALLRGAAEQAKALGKAELSDNLIDAQLGMMKLLSEHQNLFEENCSLRVKVRELEEALSTKEKLEYHHDAYWIRKEDNSLDGPYATKDWDVSKKLVRLIRDGGAYEDTQIFCSVGNKDEHVYSVCIPIDFLSSNRVGGHDNYR